MQFLPTEEVSKYFKISWPLKELKINQPFGANYVDFYKKLGMKGHNGLDLKARTGDACYAVADGEIKSYVDRTGGIAVELFTDLKEINGKTVRLRIIYYHLQRYLISSGKRVLKGQILALADNTGRYTTGSHLHFGVKVQYYINGAWVQISQNGYNGAVDPKPFFDDNIDMLPVDRRYGKTFNWLKEFTTRFKTPKIHRALIRRGRAPLSLKNRELNAIVYGGWEIEEILNPALWANWTRDTKSFFKR